MLAATRWAAQAVVACLPASGIRGRKKSTTTGAGQIPRATTLTASGDTWEVAMIKPLMVTALLANSTKSMILHD
jgi:hypothetical protein